MQLARGSVLHIHIAEQTREVEDCIQWSGRRPLEWLLENCPVDESWCLVHATHADPQELAGIAARCAVVGLCPLTEASLGDGIFPAAAFLAAGGRTAVGSDSNIQLDAAAELRALEYSQRLALRARAVLALAPGASTGRSLYAAALAGGRQALLPGPAGGGGLARGEWLDVVSLAGEAPELLGRHEDEILDSWIFVGGRALVDCVWRAGVKLVSGGRHRERTAIVARYARALEKLLA